MPKKMTMIDYIKQTSDVLTNLLCNRTALLEEFKQYYLSELPDQIYLLGSGTSCHAGMVVKKFLEDILRVKVTPMFPVPFIDQETVLSKKALVIGISQSGGSISTIHALDKARKHGLKTVAITGEAHNEINKHADMTIFMDIGEEKAVAKTKGYTATVLLLMLLGVELGKATNVFDDTVYDKYLDSLTKTIDNIPHLIDTSIKWFYKNEDELIECQRIMVVGYNNHYGTVLEGALKLLETVRIAVTGYELEEFMHGPYNSVNPSTHIFYVGSPGHEYNRLLSLYRYMQNSTKHNYLITKGIASKIEKDLITAFVDDPHFNVLEYIIPFQCISYLLSTAKGIDPSKPSDPNFHKMMGSKLV